MNSEVPTSHDDPYKVPPSPGNGGGYDDDDLSQEPDPAEIKPWDEGGVSDCGYSETVHETLMSVGQSVHNIVGPPSESVKTSMGSVGNWFQEASYAVRDIVRGENSKDFQEDASQAFSTLMNGGESTKPTVSPTSASAVSPSSTGALK